MLRACEKIGRGHRPESNHFSHSRRKPGSIRPLTPAHQTIARPYQPLKNSCDGAMGPGFRRGGEKVIRRNSFTNSEERPKGASRSTHGLAAPLISAPRRVE